MPKVKISLGHFGIERVRDPWVTRDGSGQYYTTTLQTSVDYLENGSKFFLAF